jgi:hypothetical protein
VCSTVYHPSGETVLPCLSSTLLWRFLCSSRIMRLRFEAWWSSSRCLLDSFLFFRWCSSRYWKIIYPVWLAVKDRDKIHRIIGVILIIWGRAGGCSRLSFFLPIESCWELVELVDCDQTIRSGKLEKIDQKKTIPSKISTKKTIRNPWKFTWVWWEANENTWSRLDESVEPRLRLKQKQLETRRIKKKPRTRTQIGIKEVTQKGTISN